MAVSLRIVCVWLLCGLLVSPLTGSLAVTQEPAASEDSQPPAPDADGVYKVGNGVTPPKLITYVDAKFSALARRKKMEGTTVVALVVGTDGLPRDIRVERSLAEGHKKKLQAAARSLDEQALEAVRHFRFEPATYKGEAVPVAIKVEQNFHIY